MNLDEPYECSNCRSNGRTCTRFQVALTLSSGGIVEVESLHCSNCGVDYTMSDLQKQIEEEIGGSGVS